MRRDRAALLACAAQGAVVMWLLLGSSPPDPQPTPPPRGRRAVASEETAGRGDQHPPAPSARPAAGVHEVETGDTDPPRGGLVPSVALRSGGRMPVIGFGTAALGDFAKQATIMAVEAGYTHFDSAQAREWYREDLVGEGLEESGALARRGELFITSKIHPRHLGYERTREAFGASLRDLKTDYLDLMLLHYPHCYGMCPKGEPEGDWRKSWKALEEFVDEGKVRAIGLSNVGEHELQELVGFARIQPSVVQVHSDPLSPNSAVQRFCKEHGIAFEAYSSLGTQHAMRMQGRNPILTDPVITEIAAQHGTSPGVVVLAWAIAHGQVVIPRSRQQEHIAQNLRAGLLRLTPAELARIDAMGSRR
eukprot:TRINITY_DN26468_c0_g1_i1.p1 TRINITY_DN26468_c0_g1~~TRINITY_DN26468_c0_g1_i1.p1  ORF type:complete len:388 (+),score=108.04 TRINITY_DN26468_c0_g1_i1:76-1164(+)